MPSHRTTAAHLKLVQHERADSRRDCGALAVYGDYGVVRAQAERAASKQDLLPRASKESHAIVRGLSIDLCKLRVQASRAAV